MAVNPELTKIKNQVEKHNANISVDTLKRYRSTGSVVLSVIWVTFNSAVIADQIKEICGSLAECYMVDMVIFKIEQSPYLFYLAKKDSFYRFDSEPKRKLTTIQELDDYIESNHIENEAIALSLLFLQKGKIYENPRVFKRKRV